MKEPSGNVTVIHHSCS